MESKVFHNKGIMSGGIFCLSPSEAYELSNTEIYFVDVREPYLLGYKKIDVKNLIYLPASKFDEWCSTLLYNNAYIFFDSVGLKSAEVVKKLKAKGYTNIANMAGGIVAWEQEHLPLIIDNTERLDGSCMCQLRPRLK
ncbi:MAG: rhodanese-like domain-containing protein [Bacteroidales bacterium]|nr:rhodanese-like domain-containing protein [Bacteroidales bacterium]